jgi:hypothetical protein
MILKKYQYQLEEKNKDIFIQSLIDDLNGITEIKQNYYFVSVILTDNYYYNEYMIEPDGNSEITDFTFMDKLSKPLCSYFWLRGTLIRKHEYRYKNGVIIDTLFSEM